MKRFLIINHFLKGTHQKDEVTREDLAGAKNRDCDLIVDTVKETYYDHKENQWKEVTK